MNLKKYLAAAVIFSTALTFCGCQEEEPAAVPEPVSVVTNIDPNSIVFDWQILYETQLTDFKKSDKFNDKSMFDIRDLNSDGIPELIISPSDDGKSLCEIYTYSEGLEKLEDFGVCGAFDYLPSMNCFGYEYTGDGFTYGKYCSLTGTSFVTSLDYYNNAASASGGAAIRYEVNGQDISLVEYDYALKAYKAAPSLLVGRKYTFGEDSVKYAVHYAESWGAVLSNAQKAVYKKLLNDILNNSPENDAAFELCDLDGNNIPELILSTGIAEDSDCKVYYLQETNVLSLGDGCGRTGHFDFDIKNKVMSSNDKGELSCWSLTTDDLSKYKKSDSIMDCGRKYLLTGDSIAAAFN